MILEKARALGYAIMDLWMSKATAATTTTTTATMKINSVSSQHTPQAGAHSIAAKYTVTIGHCSA